MSIASVLPYQMALLSADQISALTQADIASLTTPQLRHLTVAQFAIFSAAQIGYFSPAQIALLTNATVGALDPKVIAELSNAQLAALRPAQASQMSAAQMAALAPGQVAALIAPQLNHLPMSALQALQGLTLAQVSALPPWILAELSVAQFAALVAPNLSAFGGGRFVDLTAQQMATLTAQEANGLTMGKVAALSADALGGLSTAALAGLRSALVQAISAVQLNGMGAVALSALNPAFLTDAQVGSLTATTVASLTTQEFDALLGGRLSALSTQALAGVTLADLSSLTTAQLASFTSAQVAAMSGAQAALVLGTDATMTDLLAHESAGALSYSGALAVLQDAAKGGMTASKFADLTDIAESLTSGAIEATAYVAQIFADVVLGNSANAWWTGGATSRVALGDLSATSTQSQVDDLIGKWFLGADLPNPALPGSGLPIAYKTQTAPLYGATGVPEITDVSQGAAGDCYFLASIAEIALQDPLAIENAIQSNGNGTYSVEFQVNGQADYVTVDSELPAVTGGWTVYNGQTVLYDNGYGALWSSLLEKAFVELNEQDDVLHGGDGVAANSYADIAGGWAWPLTYLTGQDISSYYTFPGQSAAADTSLLVKLQSCLAQHGEVVMGTGETIPQGSNLVDDHMFAVTAINVGAGTVSLYNPWGHNGGGMPASFTDSISMLDAAGVSFNATIAKAA